MGTLQSNFVARLRALLPPSWFPQSADPVLLSVLSGGAALLAGNAQQLAYAALQTRISTSTGEWLDITSADFFGENLPRQPGESDANFRKRILAALFVVGPTRRDLERYLYLLTGRTPIIFEPWRIRDAGAWDAPICGWDATGGWGDLLPAQYFVTIYTPRGQGIPNLGGWDDTVGALDIPSQLAWQEARNSQPYLTDTQLLALALLCRPVGTRMWAQITSVTPSLPLAPAPIFNYQPLPAQYGFDSGGAAWDQPCMAAWDTTNGLIEPIGGLDSGYMCLDGDGYGGFWDGSLTAEADGNLLMELNNTGTPLWGE